MIFRDRDRVMVAVTHKASNGRYVNDMSARSPRPNIAILWTPLDLSLDEISRPPSWPFPECR
jgi:hypothetical protein